jgi:hypothetical protein
MRRKRQQKQIPWLEATPLEGITAIDELRALDDKALGFELHNATETERWLRTTGASFRDAKFEGKDSLAELAEHGAAYARIARETIVLIQFLRNDAEKNGDKKKGGGYL